MIPCSTNSSYSDSIDLLDKVKGVVENWVLAHNFETLKWANPRQRYNNATTKCARMHHRLLKSKQIKKLRVKNMECLPVFSSLDLAAIVKCLSPNSVHVTLRSQSQHSETVNVINQWISDHSSLLCNFQEWLCIGVIARLYRRWNLMKHCLILHIKSLALLEPFPPKS